MTVPFARRFQAPWKQWKSDSTRPARGCRRIRLSASNAGKPEFPAFERYKRDLSDPAIKHCRAKFSERLASYRATESDSVP